MDLKDFGARVRLQRLQKGWTQERLAREAGISTAFVGHIERGTRTASIETLVAIANCMDVSTDYLLGGSLENKPLLPYPQSVSHVGERARLGSLLTELQHCLSHWNDSEEDPT